MAARTMPYFLNTDDKLLSKPKLNQQFSSTEFEVRLNFYPEVHPPTHHTNCTCTKSQSVEQNHSRWNKMRVGEEFSETALNMVKKNNSSSRQCRKLKFNMQPYFN